MALTEGFGRGTSELDHHRDSSSPGQRRSELASLSFLFFDNTVQAAPAGQAGDPNTNTDLTFSHQPGGFYISLAAVGPPLMTSTHVGVECPLTCDARTRAKANEPIAILKVQLQYQYTTGHGLHNRQQSGLSSAPNFTANAVSYTSHPSSGRMLLARIPG